MAYRLVVLLRCVLTLLCKAAAFIAASTRCSTALSALDLLLGLSGRMLGHEALICMGMTRKWQERAGKCVIAHHEFERAMGGGN